MTGGEGVRKDLNMGPRGELVLGQSLRGMVVAILALTQATPQKEPRSLTTAIPPQLAPLPP